VKASGATMLRGGAFKPRTSPYDFQGLEADGLALLKEAKNHIASNYQPEARKTSPKNEQRMSAEEITAQAKSRIRK
jgi:3-deoxy-D-arabino-heptulosonate 7-phosphate (DAHP) synthase